MNNRYYGRISTANTLTHFGVQGMKWGVRRYQNADGTLTDKGKAKLKKYKDKQVKATSEYWDKTINKHGVILDASNKKAAKAMMNQDIDTANKYARKAYESNLQIKAHTAVKKAELKKVRSMSFEQMQKEKKAVRNQAAAILLLDIASVGIATSMGVPIAPIAGVNKQAIRSETRLSDKEKREIAKKAISK